MRIISKQRDYYDSGAAYGIDITNVFHRVEEYPPYLDNCPIQRPWRVRPRALQGFQIFVAGKVYQGLAYKHAYFLAWENFVSYVPQYEDTSYLSDYFKVYPSNYQDHAIVTFTRDDWGAELTINCCDLKSYGLSQIVDSTTLSHEIDQWLSNKKSKPLIEVSDSIKIAKHGFDKRSFRH